MDPGKQALDQILLIIGISAYVTGTLVLIGYFLSRSTLLKQIGIPLAAIGCIAQFAELGARWNMTGVWPLTNLYGSLSLFSAFGVLIFMIFAIRYDLWFIGFGVLGIAAISLGYATTWNEGYMPAVPALQSYWIKVHVPLVIASYASFMVAFVVSLIYLLKASFESRLGGGRSVSAALVDVLRSGSGFQASGTSSAIAADPGFRVAAGAKATGSATTMSAAYVAQPRVGAIKSDTPHIDAAAARGDFWGLWLAGLPSLSKLDILTYRIVAVGLPLLTVGIITGAWWAKEAWGAYWQWDPKETAALLSWIIYAMYMHLHTRSAWRGSRTAWVSVIGFVSIVFCYLGVNIFISGLHSYKM